MRIGGPSRGTPGGKHENVVSSLLPFSSRYWTRSQTSGLYSGGLFFGLIDDDTLFFKTGASNYAEYQARNMPRFMPPANRPLGPLGYHQVPADIIEDAESLVSWARKAVAVALASQVKKSGRAKQKTLRPAKPRGKR